MHGIMCMCSFNHSSNLLPSWNASRLTADQSVSHAATLTPWCWYFWRWLVGANWGFSPSDGPSSYGECVAVKCCSLLSSYTAALQPDDDVADDRQALLCPQRFVLELSAVLNPLFAGVHVCQQSRCPQERLTQGWRERMMILSGGWGWGGNSIVLPKGGVERMLAIY